MPSQVEIHPQTLELARAWDGDMVSFSDTHPETVRLDTAGRLEPMWWRLRDPDDQIAVRLGNTGRIGGVLEVPVGLLGGEAIGPLMLDDRMIKRALDAERICSNQQAPSSPAAQAFVESARQPIVTIANRAPRGGEHSAGGTKGEPYHLAITENGQMVFAAQLKALSYLALAGRILSLYEIPKRNTVYDERQQFRSSVVCQTLFSIVRDLVPVYQYPSREERDAAIANGTHVEIIPAAEIDRLAYVDKFGNCLVIGDMAVLQKMKETGSGTLLVNDGENQRQLPVTLTTDLDSAPENELVVYRNPSDGIDVTEGPELYELMVKVAEPNTSTDTAMFRLVSAIPDLNHLRASLRLVA